ncbi:MAG TPA: nuclear transport factor 2 family protein [Rudaea sp.]|jgi:ketosteroid isomerase-like protein|nr:nuclear transport factor 2 family protein [Rudaea sp.]
MNMKHSIPKTAIVYACVLALAGCNSVAHKPVTSSKPIMRPADDGAGCNGTTRPRPGIGREVIETECAFARTMADRDFKAFASFLDDDTVFFNKDGALLGKDAVLKEWKPYFDAAAAPFSWEPTRVNWNMKDLAYTTGPVYDASGQCIARFNSIWRKQTDGHWRIVFDKGDGKCNPTVIPGGGKDD